MPALRLSRTADSPSLTADAVGNPRAAEAHAGSRTPSASGDVFSLTKPRLSSLVLFTAGGGLWLSAVPTTWTTAVAAVLGTTLVVGGANALNNYIERDSDRLMARTRNRPLPAGRMAPGVALAFGLGLSAVSLPLLWFFTTPLAAVLALVALLTYVAVYTPLKRRSSLSTLVGAIPGAMPPLIGWTAATGHLDVGGLVLFTLLFLWQIPHSLAIGMYRQAEYERAGLVVFPSEHGHVATRRQMLLYTLPMVMLPVVLARLGVAGLPTVVVGTVLGLVMLGLVLQGLLRGLAAPWARKVFFFTLLHLTGLFAVLAVDRIW